MLSYEEGDPSLRTLSNPVRSMNQVARNLLAAINTNAKTTLPGVIACVIAFALVACGGTKPEPVAEAQAEAATTKGPRLIKLEGKTADQLQIQTESISRTEIIVPLHLTGRIEPDFGKEVDVSSRVTGKVRVVKVRPGDVVAAHQYLAQVDSREISELEAEIIEAQAKLTTAQAHEERERQIFEEQLQRPKTLIEAQAVYQAAKVRKELAESEYKRVEGLMKERIAAAKDYISAKAHLATATVEYNQASSDLQREQSLYKNKAMMKRDLQLAQAETAREKQHFQTLKQRLIFLGVTSVDQLLKSGRLSGVVNVTAPVAGVISHMDIAQGEVIHPEKSIFKITDLSTVIVRADLPEVDLNRVKMGALVNIRVPSYPKQTFKGVISYISDHVNPESRTLSVRARLENPQRKFRTNMFAEIDLEGEPRMVLACPKAAIQEHDHEKVVFVAHEQGFEERKIKTGIENETFVEVVSGIEPGEKVATQGSLMLKTELTYKH